MQREKRNYTILDNEERKRVSENKRLREGENERRGERSIELEDYRLYPADMEMRRILMANA